MELKIFFKIIIFFGALGVYSIAFSTITGRSACLLYGITGIPCPSCGITRAILYFLRGDLKQAFNYHPLFWYLSVIPLLSVRTKKTGIKSTILKKVFISMVAVMCIVWVIRMVTLFPYTEPMVINQSAIILRLLQYFINII